MGFLDSALDSTLAGYTRFGAALRDVDVDERFEEVAGKHVMVTGATGGIGKAVAQRLAENGAVVHAVGRSDSKLEALVANTPGTVVPHRADLSSMQQIAELADSYLESGAPLHGLVNNVGIMIHERTETSEGYEITYATNLLGQYVLTKRLLPALERSAPSRVVMVSSGGMYSQPLTVTNLESTEGEYNGTNAYARTKRAEVVLAEEWAKEFAGTGVTVASMHPGWVDTPGVQSSLPTFRKITGPFLRNEAEGADTIVWLVASDEAASAAGGFYHDRRPRPTHRMNRTVEDPALRERFMEHLADDARPWLDPPGPTDRHDPVGELTPTEPQE
ncbi:MAG: SDR family NAD(P)-dependent oxidoreductase [Deltaproteobacteria bacterium]|jgi:NAD(P)-dependent dehydrogenase (short-subunit alcohol dehydrogenase family)|nr:SDR family NAD(P)-dependent oxidoreductase [Deltaproteobacteria bacterium]